MICPEIIEKLQGSAKLWTQVFKTEALSLHHIEVDFLKGHDWLLRPRACENIQTLDFFLPCKSQLTNGDLYGHSRQSSKIFFSRPALSTQLLARLGYCINLILILIFRSADFQPRARSEVKHSINILILTVILEHVNHTHTINTTRRYPDEKHGLEPTQCLQCGQGNRSAPAVNRVGYSCLKPQLMKTTTCPFALCRREIII